MTKKPHRPGKQRIKPSFQRVLRAVTKLGESLEMQRIPTVPNFEPRVGTMEAFVLKNLVTLRSEYEEQELDGHHPSHDQPIVLGQAAYSEHLSTSECRSCTFC